MAKDFAGRRHNRAGAVRRQARRDGARHLYQRHALFERAHTARGDADHCADGAKADRNHRERDQDFDDGKARGAAGVLRRAACDNFDSSREPMMRIS